MTPVAGSPIFDADFSEAPEIAEFLSAAGGEIVDNAIVFADLTGDGAEEAVVPISSGGTAGDIAYFVYTIAGGDLTLLKDVTPETGRVQVEVNAEGQLVERQPVYGPDDPECCPGQVRVRTYEWDGSDFALVSDETVPGSSPAGKPTAPASGQ